MVITSDMTLELIFRYKSNFHFEEVSTLFETFEPHRDKTKDPSFLHADSEDSDQTGRMPRLI